eukprot:SAG22_NODE_185_length_15941_cov_8.668034_2_plen_55_part_00
MPGGAAGGADGAEAGRTRQRLGGLKTKVAEAQAAGGAAEGGAVRSIRAAEAGRP